LIENIKQLQTWLDTKIIGQEHLVERLIVALLSDGHVLVEGAPGLAKTKAIKTLSECLEADFHRIQFTPDLLPADVTGSDIYKPKDGNFEFQKGPIFHNLVLADEINRAPAKVQSALLEAMAERQISVGKNTYKLPDLFLVMATQNPIEQEGTYTLPEAQMDRFLLHVKVDYPAAGSERKILDLSREEQNLNFKSFEKPLTQLELDKARKSVRAVHMSEQVEEYLVQIVLATRNSDKYGGDLNNWLEYGASPRATIALDVCSKALAWLNNKDFVSPDDIRSVAHDILRHRIILSFEAEANGVSSDQVIDELLRVVPSA
jgi:MoxR-like ATPase|tara:strand:- start:1599 stop:2552 length:954 start_codon:yes stop_codon:yes gene_type:complete